VQNAGSRDRFLYLLKTDPYLTYHEDILSSWDAARTRMFHSYVTCTSTESVSPGIKGTNRLFWGSAEDP